MNDDYGGFERYHVAVFGEPATEQSFEWVLTGRHLTVRANGSLVEGAVSRGPIFYGHSAESDFQKDSRSTNNVWWSLGQQASKIFSTFDPAQRRCALNQLDKGDSVPFRDERPGANGLLVSALDDSQKQIGQQLLRDLTGSFRSFDVEAVRECLVEAGGADKLRLTFFEKGPMSDHQVRDIWKLEGPSFAWYFHGSPHVHSWVNVDRHARKADPDANRHDNPKVA